MRSPAHPHYNIRVEKVMSTDLGKPVWSHIMFHFECKYGWKTHKPWSRARLNTSAGTTVILHAAENCDRERGALIVNHPKSAEIYSPAFHRALLALWGACSHRSFDSLTDKFHQLEVEYLRPGTKLPSAITLSRDIKFIHTQYVPKIREYFQVGFQS
jgi:hypothetical protein